MWHNCLFINAGYIHHPVAGMCHLADSMIYGTCACLINTVSFSLHHTHFRNIRRNWMCLFLNLEVILIIMQVRSDSAKSEVKSITIPFLFDSVQTNILSLTPSNCMICIHVWKRWQFLQYCLRLHEPLPRVLYKWPCQSHCTHLCKQRTVILQSPVATTYHLCHQQLHHQGDNIHNLHFQVQWLSATFTTYLAPIQTEL